MQPLHSHSTNALKHLCKGYIHALFESGPSQRSIPYFREEEVQDPISIQLGSYCPLYC
jgi:hypothetical protein